jgi:hypothetical protein
MVLLRIKFVYFSPVAQAELFIFFQAGFLLGLLFLLLLLLL